MPVIRGNGKHLNSHHTTVTMTEPTNSYDWRELSREQKRILRLRSSTCGICKCEVDGYHTVLDHCHQCYKAVGTLCCWCNLGKLDLPYIMSPEGYVTKDVLKRIQEHCGNRNPKPGYPTKDPIIDTPPKKWFSHTPEDIISWENNCECISEGYRSLAITNIRFTICKFMAHPNKIVVGDRSETHPISITSENGKTIRTFKSLTELEQYLNIQGAMSI